MKDFRPISLTALSYKEDKFLIENEAVEDYRAKKNKGCILKLDLEKAFDCVDWGFLEKAKGSYNCFKRYPSMGPLSPFLFLLEVSWKKSALSGVNISEDILLQIVDRIGYKAENLPIAYIGLPLGGYPRRQFWQPVIDLIHKKLNRWKPVNISRGGRKILCKAILASFPTYYLSWFSIPQNVAISLEKITRNFFWEGYFDSKLNLVKWNLVSLPLKGGGLGLEGLKTHNFALLVKWGGRFVMED
ncbi:uncharacterized protein E5676_scaffold306G002220 [Cucumis melo var. makuwa]|uniref:Uncharacterized protein n=1 Tax=Cucumis melo var. makuwa TaxID=1194695 RepID=A0A5D3D2G4_CUCMM|nr:uncharacterized protein E6C27_scaffold67G004320 [Cucumis melo var. makuwa]TYK17925.1 uncharacterized protein E5676_scaffold306G002220 [Cucumis melo var. makuwa]